ncbi:hypothetical protein [Candidatus Marinarcus aquaticus]|uniref:Uncharacterized protein n=1 Tax=Candidatus Marinarcus aquaticus TaxID=2044504 RepID=A0A4Q0XWI0_9BACT|nr:hypothetical protein [Candidatus Marinarcus aquaticus]RXJ60609.1 hypothetical protein CRV04_00950 [Candidatus Marinarcus aquaticus]
MTALDKEIEQIKGDIYSDVLTLVDKYMSITGWDVPENDELEAKKRIVEIIKQAVNEIEVE